jgi:hypothetical protein
MLPKLGVVAFSLRWCVYYTSINYVTIYDIIILPWNGDEVVDQVERINDAGGIYLMSHQCRLQSTDQNHETESQCPQQGKTSAINQALPVSVFKESLRSVRMD